MEEESINLCDTELCLSPAGRRISSRVEEKEAGKAKRPQQQKVDDDQQITIFYNGRICICDVTEIQARAIIRLASREMSACVSKTDEQGKAAAAAARPQLLNRSLSMKRSLQRFLQKRKTRSLESSPYDQNIYQGTMMKLQIDQDRRR
ncbi:hypothetical protein Cni_G24486 [Canna indica]|uniref:Protein TIFY n=1 Tax=Canna indica TaxID=4628 RepID=A0AAQ3QPL5_9LILI|nr:hypothetical protein Cni_G24486 [Canna indica]